MKIAMYQMDIIPGNPDENRKKIAAWVKETVASHHPDTIMLPEMWTTAYTLPSLSNIVDDENTDYTIAFLQELAVSYNITVFGGSHAVNTSAGVVNRASIIAKNGAVLSLYDKMHLVPMLDEPDYLVSGTKMPSAAHYEDMKAIVGICYDLRFPELFRPLAAEGANLLTIPAEWPAARESHWRSLLKARAIENQMYVAACNRIGSYNGTTFAGQSMIINPNGDIILEGTPDQEETLIADIDITQTAETRKNIPVFTSRDSKKYRL
ncbi:carbon-nitrogen family hydrolase [Salibacterium salarium]|uniref:Carbon-nitrogen family hydrolase n=1 Tax=Salibacterium salarium TaxID=284579 RepID=A0A428MU42_9BACI|nr:carbon-nitrogen family hydrolase [Salibacterium salarium]RSL29650.1 carbon-nitrogen family hydrolase [Salibacterium salarium]